jgi:nitrile hydratase accessory protein
LNPPDLAGLPRDDAGAPVFPGLWQARAFALAMHLHARGVYAWPDFAAALAAELRHEDDYWRAWLRALEAILARQRLAAPERVAEVAELWRRAAEATPHGTPIRLGNTGS